MVKVGFGRSIVNPPLGSGLVGYFESRISKGVKDDLYARCICFNSGNKIIFIVSVDFCWIGLSIVNKVENLIEERLNIKKPCLVIHATHTHTGPLTDLNRKLIYTEKIPVDEKYLESLPMMIFNAVKDSYESVQNVQIGVKTVEVSGISFIRRYKMKNGLVITNPVDRTQIVEPSGDIDRMLNIMKIVDEKGQLLCIAINFALHPDTIGGDFISADWPGMLVERISKHFDCNAIFFNGAAGDINHINPYDSETRSSKITEKIVSTLFESVKENIDRIKCVPVKNAAFSQDVLKMPKRKISEKDIEQAKIDIEKFPPTNLKAMIARALLSQAEIKEDYITNRVSLLTLDNLVGAFFLSGELFSSIGLKIKDIMPFESKWVIENCNGYLGYIPDERAFIAAEENKRIKGEEFQSVDVSEAIGMEASYETSPISCKLTKDAENTIISGFKNLLEKHIQDT